MQGAFFQFGMKSVEPVKLLDVFANRLAPQTIVADMLVFDGFVFGNNIHTISSAETLRHLDHLVYFLGVPVLEYHWPSAFLSPSLRRLPMCRLC